MDHHPTRRRYLQATAGTSTICFAGCAGDTGTGDANDNEPVSGSWPMYQYDSNRTGHNSNAEAPREGVSERWSFEPEGSEISSPVVGENSVYITSSAGIIYRINAATGEKEWEHEIPGDEVNQLAPALYNGLVYIAAGNKVVSLKTDGTKNWEKRVPNTGAPATVGESLYVGATKLNPEDGSIKWTNGEVSTDYPAITDSTVYTKGYETVFAVGPKNRWQFNPGFDDLSDIVPVVAKDGAVYFGSATGGTNEKVFAVDTVTGEELWSYFFGSNRGNPQGGICLNGSNLYCLESPASMVILDSEQQQNREETSLVGGTRVRLDDGADSIVYSPPVTANETIYASTTKGVYALDLEGNQRWHYGDLSGWFTPPAVTDQHLFVGTEGGTLVALRGS